jgi:uncharacterized membrane protein YkoI
MIAAVAIGYWRFKLNSVIAFWIAYILTRPLGASIGDYLSQAPADGGLGLGTVVTSVLFLFTILAAIVYLAVTKRDEIVVDGSSLSSGKREIQPDNMPLVHQAAVFGGIGLMAVMMIMFVSAHAVEAAKISDDQAKTIASNAVPGGAVMDVSRALDDGSPVISVAVNDSQKQKEVVVIDAATGKVNEIQDSEGNPIDEKENATAVNTDEQDNSTASNADEATGAETPKQPITGTKQQDAPDDGP